MDRWISGFMCETEFLKSCSSRRRRVLNTAQITETHTGPELPQDAHFHRPVQGLLMCAMLGVMAAESEHLYFT